MSDRERMMMDKVLRHACDAKVLMFCSASDQGSYDGAKDYPAAHRPESFFRIGAAANDGRSFDSFASPENVDFLFPGAEVIELHDSDRTPHSDDNDTKLGSMTGSSVPTALGAGLAATILYSFKAATLAYVSGTTSSGMKDRPILFHHVRNIMDPKVMRNAFKSLGSTTDGRFIKLWESFEPTSQTLQDPSKSNQDKVDSINLLCRTLLREYYY
jgi:hypothetical protein